MLRLNLKPGARWLDLGHGVRIKVEPLTTQVMSSCRRDPAVLAINETHRKALEAAETPEAIAEDVRDDLALAMAKAVARRVVVDWEGVGDDNGKPIPVSPAGIDALMNIWVLFEAFQQRYVAAGFLLEIVADRQKRRFKADPANAGKFISSGLWAWSRHPNYFGEILLWLGVAMVAAPVLSGWQLVSLISPVFVVLLLTRVSGIPLLEARSDKRWGSEPEYQSYKLNTPVLIPRPPK
jgi:protein-S-isoprenylcysteine O-methyltransferase Ste14